MTQRRFDLGPLAAFAQRSFLGCLLCALCASGKLAAALDAETNKPYHLQVVLHFSGHRWLTDPFQKQIKRELHDSLQAALGDLAEVEVRDHHPRLKEVETNGLRAALDSWNFLSDEKLHFLFIDFVDGQYEIQSRQYDGFVGLASPTVRHAQVADRQLVARQASLLIDQDFGLAGTINLPKKGPGDIYEIALKGGGLGAFLGHWLKKGDILAISQISNQGSRGPGAVPHALDASAGNSGATRGILFLPASLPPSESFANAWRGAWVSVHQAGNDRCSLTSPIGWR